MKRVIAVCCLFLVIGCHKKQVVKYEQNVVLPLEYTPVTKQEVVKEPQTIPPEQLKKETVMQVPEKHYFNPESKQEISESEYRKLMKDINGR